MGNEMNRNGNLSKRKQLHRKPMPSLESKFQHPNAIKISFRQQNAAETQIYHNHKHKAERNINVVALMPKGY